MRFEVYCDESQPDVFWTKARRKAKYLLIGGVWVPARGRQKLKADINRLKARHEFPGEVKWHKVHEGRKAFYKELVDLFIGAGEDVRSRCIAVEAAKVNLLKFHQNDAELGFYKFYYQMLKHWMQDFNEYVVFCDEKTNRAKDRLKVLQRTLSCATLTSKVVSVQALPSREVVLLQLADFLLGIVSTRLNESAKPGSFKDRLAVYLERRLGRRRLGPTYLSEPKFNIFRIDLKGGW